MNKKRASGFGVLTTASIVVTCFTLLVSQTACQNNESVESSRNSRVDSASDDNSKFMKVLEAEYVLYDGPPPDGIDLDIKISRGEVVKLLDSSEGARPYVELADGVKGYVEPWGMEKTGEQQIFANRIEPSSGNWAKVIAEQARVFRQDPKGEKVDWNRIRAGFFPKGMRLECIEKKEGGYWKVGVGGFSYYIYGSALTSSTEPETGNSSVSFRDAGEQNGRIKLVLEASHSLSVVEKNGGYSQSGLIFEVAVAGVGEVKWPQLATKGSARFKWKVAGARKRFLNVSLSHPIAGYRIVRQSPNSAVIEINTNLWGRDSSGLSGVLVFLDPGHGGNEVPGFKYGAKSLDGSRHERDLVLVMSSVLRHVLESRGAKVSQYRDSSGDYYRLYDRIDRAEAANADIYVSVHYNQAPLEWTEPERRAKPEGAEVFYNHPQAARLAAEVGKRLPNHKPEAYKFGNYAVIRQSSTPAILIELGFLTNPGELGLLTSDSFMKRQAEAIGDGIEAYVISLR